MLSPVKERDKWKKNSSTWRVFSLKELQSATNNFNYDNKIAEGGFGSVYWGQLWDGSQVIRDHAISVSSLISFICSFKFIGLQYQITNIQSKARVADFGFAKLIPDGATHVTTKVKGTLGYLAPEYAMYGKASESCDVYSFGIVLLELASGKKSIEKPSPTVKLPITEWAVPLARERKFKEIADPKLNGNYVEAELKRMVLVALICAQSMPENRPTMLEVVDLLKGESKENLTDLENNEMFRPEPAGISQVLSGPNGSSDFVYKEKNSEANANEMGS
ncbi:hypothetical protein B296_00029224 [Ensete ventricosum]|uniref:Protein kinase domain-containing protein n=1 Tax=Ensete ventricosum TaxID=4639 RepID=A0A426YUE6_ENSVE|nr:hypothetical protein B296_00029224 [Ensete ventricosum]